LKQTEELTLRFNRLMTPENQTLMLGAFNNVSKAATAIETIPRQLEPTLSKLPALTAQADRTLNSVVALSQDVSTLSRNVNTLATRLQAPDGTVDRLGSAADQLGSAAVKVDLAVTPLASDARTTLHTFNRTLDTFNTRPQSILFGTGSLPPGPGETGFVAPAH
jgi:phospholipid/cholesterol/gamma-HCH transport system substrate-binding protein